MSAAAEARAPSAPLLERTPVRAALGVALFAGAFLFFLRFAGASPSIWFDTVADEAWARGCLELDLCPETGIGTSRPPLVLGLTWLRARIALSALGLDADAAYLVLLALDALGVLLAFVLAKRLAGAVAGALAAALAAWATVALVGTYESILFNSHPLPFLGLLFGGLFVMAAREGRVRFLVAAAAVLATLVNVHPACASSALVLPAAAPFLARGRRLLVVAACAFAAVATYFSSPAAWDLNLAALVRGLPPMPGAGGASGDGASVVGSFEWLVLGAGAAALLAAWLRRGRGAGAEAGAESDAESDAEAGAARRAHVALALVLLAPAAVIVAATAAGAVPAGQAKYLFHLLYLLPVALACGVAAVVFRVAARWSASGAAQRALRWAGPAATLSVAGALALWPIAPPREHDQGTFVPFTFNDVARVSAHLAAEGAGRDEMLQQLRSVNEGELLLTLAMSHPLALPPTRADDGRRVTLVKVRPEVLPAPLPAGWRVLARDGRAVLLALPARSRFDWTRARVCVDGACEPYSANVRETFPDQIDAAAGGLRRPVRAGARVTLRLPLARAGASGVGEERRVWMPRFLGRDCAGGTAALAGGAPAESLALPGHAGREVELTWQTGTPSCASGSLRGRLPLFFEVTREEQRALEKMLTAEAP